MRVVSGLARGKRLEVLEGDDVRPTTDRVKEAVFSIIQFNIEGRRFLDLFSGSGQMGIEALSRGAKQAVFVDQSRRSIKVINNNIDSVGFRDRARVVNTGADAFLASNSERFDIAFLDPPYGTGLLQAVLPAVVQNMNKGGLIICESPLKEELPEKIGEFSLDRTYRYGKIKISIFCVEDECL
ncbi:MULTISPECIES: 16S rRNA (guanine(966)-N(2))-methyltransferase RsmD [unclassified Ruminococcus]|uniref:16S rRNA (guanine(966)-N(2))-methyltransferase RsmD n=1 Tax=unclassified Ruminococcus TaxID=2608920 RepID=UPI002109DA28|nr:MULTISPECIES: 16S rRNA (guanine(966)-N(2))-methyltransferase RsmD [unclassified Ruminococcus]MCQ4022328.1 16S rRNA (guanine(966)-N(2))-methyltransferase RsmD [Ruminococcus sp. zg-924]MCQ4114656.1 16S rRNA (guanine(966)-N(2))-methyltransferase RsmD [Ruminococcus sp. zg-921]